MKLESGSELRSELENSAVVQNKQVGEIIFPPRKVYLKTYGCQMNEHDSERMLSNLLELNFTKTEVKEEADLVLFNTCAIRDLSNSKFYSHLGEMKAIKEQNKNVLVGAAGCIAQTEGEELLKKYHQLDFAFGTDAIDQLNDMLYRLYAGENKFWIHKWDRTNDYSIETKIVHQNPVAMVNIMKGCDNFCSYCIVPYTRGREKSRRVQEVVDDIKKLVELRGIQEVQLLGQNVNSYGHKNNESLAKLLIELEKINGLEIIRYTSSHPKDVSDELIEVHGLSKKLSRHLHLPVQSGSNSVLERMLREYSVEHYLGLLEKLRKAKPDIVLTSDIICGFPNETESEHQDTMKLLDLAQFDSIYAYAYSSRPGTKASKLEDTLPQEVRMRRLHEVQAKQLDIQSVIRSSMVGNTYTVLVDGTSDKKGVLKWQGRTNCMRIVHFTPLAPEDNYQWNWVDVKITSSTRLSSQGEIVKVHGKKMLN